MTTKKKKVQSKHYVRAIMKLSAMALIVFFGMQIVNDLGTTLQLQKEKKDAQEVVAMLEVQKSTLSEELQKLEDPEYVKRYARGKYMVTKDGEQVFKLPSKGDE
ncbi:MAG: FtsB family cell division protein [Erysipelotrichaceae bacterium]